MKSFVIDNKFGIECESRVLEILNKNFKLDSNIQKSRSVFSSYDFYSTKYFYELKSRNNKYAEYYTTLISEKKIKDNIVKGQDENGKQKYGLILLFNFTDGLYYIEYEPELFSTFELKMFKRNTRLDYKDKEQMYYHIPIKYLQKIL
jgi:hypothetical protein